MKRKIFVLVLVVTLLLAACSQQAVETAAPEAEEAPETSEEVTSEEVVEAPAEPITLTFSHFWASEGDPAGEVVQASLDAWLSENPDVQVQVELMSHDEYYDKFRVLASAQELPDVFIMNADMTTPLVASGQVLDITDEYSADEAWSSLINPGLLAEWTRDGQLYGLPSQVIMTHQIYYNTEIFEEVGIMEFPETWEDFSSAITTLQEAGYTPIALGAKAGWPLFDCVFGTLSFRATGVDWYNDLLAYNAEFTDPEFVLALETFQDLVEMGAFNEDATSLDNMQARTLYFNREAAMFIEGGWAIAEGLADQDVEAVTDIAIWPALPGGKGQPNEITWASGWGWAANSNLTGAEQEAAISLLKALSDENYGRMRFESGLGIAQVITEFDASSLPRLFVLENELAADWIAVPVLTLGFPSSTTDVLSNGLQEIMTGQTSPEEVAASIQADYILTKP